MRFLWWIGLWMSTSLMAQEDLQIVRKYTRADGLSNSEAYFIYEDSRRFLWIATNEGLNRYDGYKFRSYFQNKRDPNGLPHNLVLDMLEYQPGLLLLATGNGLAVLNLMTDEFENQRIRFMPLAAGQGAIVSSLNRDEDGNYWINHDGEIDILNRNLEFLYRLSDQPWARDLKGALLSNEDLVKDQMHRVWLATDTSGLQVVDMNRKEVFNFKNNPEGWPYLKPKFIRSFLLDEQQQTLWLAPWGDGLYKYNLKDGTCQHQLFNLPRLQEKSSINFILRLDAEHLLCCAGDQTVRVACDDMSFRTVPGQSAEKNETQLGFGYYGLKTQNHQYWIGSMKGLIQLNDQNVQSELYLRSATDDDYVEDLILASTGKLYSLYGDFTLIETEKDRLEFHPYTIPFSLRKGKVTALGEPEDGLIWIGTTEGIITFNPRNKKFEPLSLYSSVLQHAHINLFFLDRDKDMWICTREPFHIYTIEKKTQAIHEIKEALIDAFGAKASNARISSIQQDREGTLWMSSALGGGILRLDAREKTWTLLPKNKQDFNILGKKGIVSFCVEDHGTLWLSSVIGSGLIKYTYATDHTEYFGREDGLLSDNIQTILADDQANLWMTTEYGVSVFDRQALQVRYSVLFNQSMENAFTIHDPFTSNLVVGLKDRFHFISTSINPPDVHLPEPILEGMWINNEKYLLPADHKAFKLQHDQKNIAFRFTAPYFEHGEWLQFSYWLVGADETWKPAGETRTAAYAVLSPGTYTFKLRTGKAQGIWGDAMEMVTFTIAPPFWKSFWFLLTACALVTGSGLWIGRSRINHVRKESALRQKIAETEMMALRAQMNPHFIFNSLNSIDALIHSNDKYHATMYLNKFAKLIRNILDSSKQSTVTVSKDLETLKLYIELEQFRTDNKFTADIRIDPSLLPDDLKVPPLIIQPYVENAILHGLCNRFDTEGKLFISLRRVDDVLQYTIEDNGVGRAYIRNGHAQDKASYGMEMSRDRIKLFNQEEKASVIITDLLDHGQARGTKVEIRLNIA